MKKRLMAVCVGVCMTAALLAGCGSSAKETTTAAPAGSSPAATQAPAAESPAAGDVDLSKKNIVVILKNNTSPFFLTVAEGAEAAGKELGVNVSVQTPVGTQEGAGNEEQTQLVEQAIASQADLVVMCPVDSEGIVPAIKKLKEANIPVVNLNTKIGGSEVMWETFVAIENYDVGYGVADELCKAMEGKGKIFIIEGTTGAQTSIDRTAGAKDAIAKYPDIEIVADQSASYNRATAMDVVQNLLQQTPDVNAIFCCNDEMALGSVEAVDAAGKGGQIFIGGVDGNTDALQAIQDGTMYVTCNSQPYNQGYGAVEAAVKVLKGEQLEDFYKTDSAIITKENVADFIGK